MSNLFDVTTKTISEHLTNIYESGELDKDPTIRKFRIVQLEGTRQVAREIEHYNLDAVISVGYRVNSIRATQFRRWATQVLKQYAITGYVIDRKRMENGAFLGEDYFERLLEEIREIRLSERRFYQKVTDIYATSIDYDAKAETTRLFFARVQNQLHWAIHGETAAETIYRRADSSKEHMGLTTWKDAPNGKIQKFDVVIAKNYLTQEELSAMARIVNAYLDLAELRAEEQVPMTMEDWAEQFEGVLRLSRKEILTNAGSISAKIAEQHALSEFEKYRIVQDQLYQSDFDRILLEKDSYTNELPEAKDGGE